MANMSVSINTDDLNEFSLKKTIHLISYLIGIFQTLRKFNLSDELYLDF